MQFIKIFDFFGFRFTIPFKQKEKYNTFFGVLITLSIFTIGIVSFFYFGNDMIHKQNPYVHEFRTKVNTSDNEISLKNSNLFIAFSIYSEAIKQEFVNSSIYEAYFAPFFSNRSAESENKRIIYDKELMKPCKKEYLPQNNFIQNYYKDKNIENFYCLNTSQYSSFFIKGTYDENIFLAQTFQVDECANSSKCGTKEEINKLLKNSWITLYIVDLSADLLNFENPTKQITNYHQYILSNQNRKEILIKYEKLEILTDNSDIFTNENKQVFERISKVNSEIFKKEDTTFARIIINCDDKKTVIKRRYDKLLKILAEVGGLLNFIIIFSKLILFPIIKIFLLNDVINTNYYYLDYEKNKEINNNFRNKIDKKLPKKKLPVILNDSTILKKKISFDRVSPNIIFPNKNKIFFIDTKNFLKKKICKMKTNFLKTCIFFYFNIKCLVKRLKIDNRIDESLTDFYEKIEINNILQKLHEFEIIKYLIFDSEQLMFLNNMPKCLLREKFNKMNSDRKSIHEIIENIRNRKTNSKKDGRILKFLN